MVLDHTMCIMPKLEHQNFKKDIDKWENIQRNQSRIKLKNLKN